MRSCQRLIDRPWIFLSQVIRRWKLALVIAALLLALTGEGPPPARLETRVNRQLAGKRFDFVSWEISALWTKLTYDLVAPQRYLDQRARHDLVLDYLRLVGEVKSLERKIHRVYSDPDVEDPAAATADLRARRIQLRRALRAYQPLAEAILEEQVAFILAEEGFGALGQEIPPVSVHFTAPPLLLVISPRDHIETTYQLSLAHGLSVARREAIEEKIDARFDVSSLITDIGGLSAYPAMVLENTSVNWMTEVIAHEWTHHYLIPRPLGWNYNAATETRTINETVASIVGEEIGRRAVARYYPERLPPEPQPKDAAEKEPSAKPTEFDFRAEMRETRVRVDELLARGKIEEAEAYMEDRRQVFVDHGYHIRKLNQAYFAFHGAYAAEPGAAGKNLIGPAVRELHARSPDLHTFVARAAGVTTLAELRSLLGKMENDK